MPLISPCDKLFIGGYMIEVKGLLEKIIFHNEENGYTVLKLNTEDGDLTCTGNAMTIKEGREYRMKGDFTYNQKYGEQFSFTEIEEVLPTEVDGIIAYLSSGNIPFIGTKTAEKIVDKFKEDTLKIIDENPKRLLEIEGIGQKKLEKIKEAFREQSELRSLFIYLSKFDISQKEATKIYRAYGQSAVEIVRTNPYKLGEDIRGFGFKRADELARVVGIREDSDLRINSAIKYVLKLATYEGHTYLPEKELIHEAKKFLNCDEEKIEKSLSRLMFDQEIYIKVYKDHKNVYFTSMYRSENFSAGKLITLLRENPIEINRDELNDEIDDLESEYHKFGEKQRFAIINSVANKVSLITGGPGTGKTTTLKAIIEIFENMDKKVVLAAPTGRAAKRMEESTKRKASTIHKLLDIHSDSYFEDVEEVEADVVIVDEFSMVDLNLFNILLQALKPGTTLIMVGDKDQLPSVGAGNVLADIISSGLVPMVNLDEVFRQEKESLIITNAHLINQGKMPIVNGSGSDFYLIRENSMEEIAKKIVDLVKNRLPNYYGVNPVTDIQVLSPVKKTMVGVNNLNKLLQEALNKNKEKIEVSKGVFKKGDRVMQMKNNYNMEYEIEHTGNFEKGVFNGDTGFVEEVNEDEKYVVVRFDENKLATYEYKDLEELSLSYATTIHKSQGSEYPVVVIPMTFFPPILANRNLIYTGVTRASKLVVLVGSERYLQKMIENNKSQKRYSSLDESIKEGAKKFDFFKK